MLRENQYILRQVNIGLDLVLSVAAFFLAHLLRQGLNIYVFPDWRVSTLANYINLLPIVPLVTVAALLANGLYASQRMRTRTRELARRLAVACFESTLLMTAAIFVVKRDTTSRPFIFLLAVILYALLLAKTWAVRRVLTRVRRRGYNYRRVVLVGSGRPLEEIAAAIGGNPFWGLKVEGIVTDRPEFQGAGFDAAAIPEAALGLPVVADLARAADVLWRTPVDEVIFVPDAAPLSGLRPLMEVCEEMGVRMHLPLNFYNTRICHALVDRFDDLPVLSYWPTQVIGPALLFKYAFDRVAAAALLALCSPLLLATALAIRLTSRRGEPAFFSQTRCGLNGRLFTLWKFRTMFVDAEARRAELAALNEQAGPVFKMRHDPRVTPLGRWLRKFSIDELPQLWNVLKGDMSLVGPRPPLPGEVEKYDRWQRRRLSMKPGMTCLWQVMGRNTLPFETWMKLDLQYIDHWSLWVDFKILARTVYVVVTGYGAM
jgi:exopolysaccharide biosynthesis polyprenyl glycosylphosphotransferase